ncbi:MAG: hypothetical protein K8F25_01145, partial [Fimbriimonadaceae bacterium]|nr:hypothetical protein [Alphaproteobacteria bacterium]
PVRAYISERKDAGGKTRKAVFDAWKAVEKVITTGSFSDRSREFDAARSKPYFGTTIEKAARSFERYIHDRMVEQGASNDYLANINLNAGAYPTEAEMQEQGIRQAYDELFKTIEARKSDRDTVGLFEDDGEFSPPSDYTPLDSFIPNDKVNLGARAKEYVMRQGKQRGVEVILAFDGDGNVVSDGYGTAKSVGFSRLHSKMNGDPASNIVVHHNHPSSSSFSRNDIALLAKPGAKVVWVHGADGRSYRATLNPELRGATDPSYLYEMLQLLQRGPMGAIKKVLQQRVTDEKISVDTAQLLLTHFRNVALHKAGITDYFASKPFAADAEIEQAVEQSVAAIRKALDYENITIGRSAKRIRYIGDMGVLAEGNRHVAAEGRPDSGPDRGSGRNDRGEEKGEKLDEEDDPQFTPPPGGTDPNRNPEDGLFATEPGAKQQEEYAANLEAAKKYEPLPYPSRADAMVAKNLIVKRPRDGVYVTRPAGREHLANYKAQILKEDEAEFKPAPFKRSSPRQGQPAAPTSFDPLHDQSMEAWADDTLRYWGAGQKVDQMIRAAALEEYTTLKDRHVAISRLVEAIERRLGKALPDAMNPFLASRLFAGRMPEAVRVFEETRVKPFVEAMAKHKITPAELGPWLQARHVEERNNHLGQSFDPGDPFYEAMADPAIIGASGWSQNEADAVLEKV